MTLCRLVQLLFFLALFLEHKISRTK
jgi:hypothetical protein